MGSNVELPRWVDEGDHVEEGYRICITRAPYSGERDSKFRHVEGRIIIGEWGNSTRPYTRINESTGEECVYDPFSLDTAHRFVEEFLQDDLARGYQVFIVRNHDDLVKGAYGVEI